VFLFVTIARGGEGRPTPPMLVMPPVAPCYIFDPQPDITAFELARAVDAIMPALASIAQATVWVDKIKDLPRDVRRHFRDCKQGE